MSDSKWVRLITALVANAAEIKECLVKPIWDNVEPTRQLYLDENMHYDFNYYATAMEAMVSGKPRGWYTYKEIEWLDFPRVVTSKRVGIIDTQSLDMIKEVIDQVGQFHIELTEENLRLYAYIKKQ